MGYLVPLSGLEYLIVVNPLKSHIQIVWHFKHLLTYFSYIVVFLGDVWYSLLSLVYFLVHGNLPCFVQTILSIIYLEVLVLISIYTVNCLVGIRCDLAS